MFQIKKTNIISCRGSITSSRELKSKIDIRHLIKNTQRFDLDIDSIKYIDNNKLKILTSWRRGH